MGIGFRQPLQNLAVAISILPVVSTPYRRIPRRRLQLRSLRRRRFVLFGRKTLAWRTLRRRHERSPGHSRLRLVVAFRDNGRRGRDNDEMIAAGTLDLSAGELAVALDVLLAMRAGEFEFAHKPGGLVDWLR